MVIRGCHPPCLSRLCPRPSPSPRSPSGMFPPGSGSCLGKAVIYLQTCLVASPGRGRAAGWGHGGMEALGAIAGAGNEAQPGVGVVLARDPLWSAASRIWDNSGSRRHSVSPQGWLCGHCGTAARSGPVAQPRVLLSGQQPWLEATGARISPCTNSFARPCCLTQVTPGSFLCCDLEEEKKNKSKFVFPVEINFSSASAWDGV